jgi:hypothetical protein
MSTTNEPQSPTHSDAKPQAGRWRISNCGINAVHIYEGDQFWATAFSIECAQRIIGALNRPRISPNETLLKRIEELEGEKKSLYKAIGFTKCDPDKFKSDELWHDKGVGFILEKDIPASIESRQSSHNEAVKAVENLIKQIEERRTRLTPEGTSANFAYEWCGKHLRALLDTKTKDQE